MVDARCEKISVGVPWSLGDGDSLVDASEVVEMVVAITPLLPLVPTITLVEVLLVTLAPPAEEGPVCCINGGVVLLVAPPDVEGSRIEE